MDFDFDELGDEGECPAIPSMSVEDFRNFGRRLRDALDAQRYADLDQAMAEALWVKNVPLERVRDVVRELVGLLREVAAAGREEDHLRGCALVHALFRFSLSASMDRVFSRPRRGATSVALIFTSAGGHAEEAGARASFYAAKGLTTVVACRCIFPVAFERYQEAQLAGELQEHLAGGTRLVVHLCGGHGHAAWCRIAGLWRGGQRPFHRLAPLGACLAGIVWECGPPREALPDVPGAEGEQAGKAQGPRQLSLEETLRMQRELYAAFSKDDFVDRLEDLEETHKMGSAKFIAARNKLFLEVQAPIISKYGYEGSHRGVMQMLSAAARWNGHADYRRNVDRLNCLLGINAEGTSEHTRRVELAQKERTATQADAESGEVIEYEGDTNGVASCTDACLRLLLARHMPEVSPGKLLLEAKAYVQGSSGRGAFWLGDDYALKTDSGQPLWGDPAGWAATDAAMETRVPRAFLYSKADTVVPADVVEAHVKLAERQQSREGDVISQEAEGPHMQLWQASRPACEQALTALLKRAGVLKE